MSDEQFRPQTPARPLWKMQEDFMSGLRQTTQNNQPLMALHYAHEAIDNLIKRVELLEKDIVDLLEKLEKFIPAEKSTKARKAEEVSVEA